MSETVPWSYTTINTLRQCNRRYYFASVMATHGRKTPVRRKAYELKLMQNLLMWQGSVVDKFLETVLIPAINEKKQLDFAVLAEAAVEMARKQYKFSKNKFYTNAEQKKGDSDSEFCILDIHELGKQYANEVIENCFLVIRNAILKFAELRMPDGILLVEFLKSANALQPNVNNWIVYLERARVKPQMDLIAYHNWKPVVMDWKLSASYTSDYSRQLLICGLTVYFKRLEQVGKPPYEFKDIKLFEVNIYKGEIKEHTFTQEEVNNMIDYINLTSSDLFLMTGDKKFEDFDIEDFGLTENQSSCRMCNFRSLCSYMLLNNNSYDEKPYLEYVQNQQFS